MKANGLVNNNRVLRSDINRLPIPVDCFCNIFLHINTNYKSGRTKQCKDQ